MHTATMAAIPVTPELVDSQAPNSSTWLITNIASMLVEYSMNVSLPSIFGKLLYQIHLFLPPLPYPGVAPKQEKL